MARRDQKSVDEFARDAERVSAAEREIQDAIDAKKTNGKKRQRPQTGARAYPTPPFPKQHLKKPGAES